MIRKCVAAALGVLGVIVLAVPAGAQNFPDHPVKIVVPYPAGGPGDTVARVTTQGLGAELGGSVVIENIPGAAGRIGVKAVTRAAPDGYTLLLGSSNEVAITPALYGNLDYDPVKALAPVVGTVTDSVAIVVNPTVQVHTLAELVSYTKDHPGKLTSGSTLGIVSHLALLYLRAHLGAEMVFVPYKGGAPALADAMGNQIQVTCSAKSVLLPLIKAGKLRALAVSSAARWPELPDVPTFAESGLAAFPSVVVFGLLAPAGTPPAIVAKLSAAESALLKSAATEAAIAKLGMSASIQTTAEFAKVLGDQVGQWKAVVKESGAHLGDREQ
jgi:tripartite-type tricarboxylate transporter receptor subunit TctC